MRKLIVCLAAMSGLMLSGFTHAQSYTSIHTFGKLPIVKAKGMGNLDLTMLIKSHPKLAFTVRDPKSGEISYTRDTIFYGKSDGYYYQGQKRLQGYPVSTDITTTDCKLTDLKAPPEEIPALATTTINYTGNLSAGSPPPADPVFSPTDPGSFNFVNAATIYDSLGVQHNLSVYFVKLGLDTWNTNIYVDGAAIGSGQLIFGVNGMLVGALGMSQLKFNPPGAQSQELSLHFQGFTQFGLPFSSNPAETDGMPAGIYSAYQLDDNGYVSFNYSNGQSITFGKVAIFSL